MAEKKLAEKQPVDLPPAEHIEEYGIKMVEWISANRNVLISLFVLVVALIGGYNLYEASRINAMQERSAEFARLLRDYEQALGQTDTAVRAREFASVRRYFEEFAGRHSGPLANHARFMVGNTHFHEAAAVENLQAAAEAYENYIRQASTNRERALGHYSRGYALESLTFLPDSGVSAGDALAAFERAQQLAPGSWIDFEGRLARARILSVVPGRRAEARELLQSIIDDRGDSGEPALVREDAGLTPQEEELLGIISSPINTFGIVATARLMLERLGGADPENA